MTLCPVKQECTQDVVLARNTVCRSTSIKAHHVIGRVRAFSPDNEEVLVRSSLGNFLDCIMGLDKQHLMSFCD